MGGPGGRASPDLHIFGAARARPAEPRGFRSPTEGPNTHARSGHPMEGFRPVAPKARAPGPANRKIRGGGRVRQRARNRPQDTQAERNTL